MLSVEANSMFADLMKLSIASLRPIVNSKKKTKKLSSCKRDKDRSERRKQRGSDKKKVKHDEGEDRERTPWETEKREREMGPDRRRGRSTDLPASNPDACGHHRSVGIHTCTCTHTQMHSDNPSAPAKCCLIQHDLHSTEKANSLPLTVWKT